MIDSKAPLFANISIHAGYSLFWSALSRAWSRSSEENGRKDAKAAGLSRRAEGLVEGLWNDCATEPRYYLQPRETIFAACFQRVAAGGVKVRA
ncbi:MAG: hypothetical protein ACLQG3_07660 [Terracidiphilus sp.]